jgi:hypothetical protein
MKVLILCFVICLVLLVIGALNHPDRSKDDEQ